MTGLLLETVDLLSRYADEGRCLELLQPHAEALVGEPSDLVSCEVLASRAKVRHKADQVAQSSVDVLYRLGIAGSDQAVVVAVRATAHDPIVSSRFPHDSGMAALPAVLAATVARCGEFVKYSPSKSCVLRYRDGPRSKRWTYSKTYPRVRAPQIYDRWRQLDALARSSDGRLRIAELLSFEEQSGTITQRGLVGETLAAALRSQSTDLLAESVAQGLAVIHSSAMDCPEGLDPAARQRQTLRKIKHLGDLVPAAVEPLTAVEARLRTVADSASSRLRVNFGDFHPGQIMVERGNASFCDFDSFVIDEPERDLGEFIATAVLGDLGDAATAHAFCVALLRAYQRLQPIDHERLEWHSTVEFVTHVAHSARALRPNWPVDVCKGLETYSRLRRILAAAEAAPRSTR